MVVLRFRSDAVRRDCCDLGRLRVRWGEAVARQVSRRLQQLEAMSSIGDLAFLPFDHDELADGIFHVAVAEHLVLVLESEQNASEGETAMHTIFVIGLRDVSTVARKP